MLVRQEAQGTSAIKLNEGSDTGGVRCFGVLSGRACKCLSSVGLDVDDVGG